MRNFSLILSKLVGVFVFLSVVELLVCFLIPNSYIFKSDLSLGTRLFIFSYSYILLIAVVAAIATPLFILQEFCVQKHSGRAVKKGLGCLAALVLLGLLLLYWSSWAFYRQLGKFLDYDAISLWLTQPAQVAHWVETDTVIAVVSISLFVGIIITYSVPRWMQSLPSSKQKATQRCFTIVTLLCFSWAVGVDMKDGMLTRLFITGDLQAASPIAQLLADFKTYNLRKATHELVRFDLTHTIRRPLISNDQYLKTINSSLVRRWNVILIVVESLGADQITSYGGQRKVMPFVEALAQKSRVFRNAWTQSSHTSYAAHVPLSSHYPLRSVTRYIYPEKFNYPRVLLYDVLKSLGYRTTVFSSSNENWEGMINYLRTENLDKLFHASSAAELTIIDAQDTVYAQWARRTNQAGSLDDSTTLAKAIEWLEKQEDRPFFMYVNLQNSHLPYRIPAGFPRRFAPESIDFTIRFGYFPRDKVKVVKDIYADSLAYVDAQIGRLIEYLTHRGMMEESIIVVTGDHGQAFYEHDFAAHSNKLFEEVVRVPLIVYAPGLEGGVDHRAAQHVDIAPTILDIMGLPVHPSFQGRSLLEAKPDQDKSVYLIAQTTLAYESAIIRSGWKLVHEMLSRRYRLYDLKNDPMEKFNLVEGDPEVLQDLADRLHSWEKMQIDYYSTASFHTREYPPIPKY